MREGNVLRVWVEPYEELPVDKDAFKGGIPHIEGIIPFSPFGFYIKRKLFIHNLGHAVCAYFGWQKGYEYIYECCGDRVIADTAEKAMKESARALSKEYNVPAEELNAHIVDLLFRFKNRALGDTAARVGKDPIRKLGLNDRLIGAAVYCIGQGIEPENIIKGIAAALMYDNKEDAAAVQINSMIREKGIGNCVEEVCGITEGSILYDRIISSFREV
jgi:mannitol-1-phosphate 5-dehydrogenase